MNLQPNHLNISLLLEADLGSLLPNNSIGLNLGMNNDIWMLCESIFCGYRKLRANAL